MQNKLTITFNKMITSVANLIDHTHLTIRYDRYDSVYLTCSKKLTGSQLSLPHGTNKKLKYETKNKTMIMIGPVQSRCHEGSPTTKMSCVMKVQEPQLSQRGRAMLRVCS